MRAFHSFSGMCAGLVLGVSLLAYQNAEAEDPPERPNIIFFLVDDLGWTDINGFEGPNGETYENAGGEFDSRYYYTPNIAKLANKGVRFTNAYAACPFCGPSRASILTGKYPARIGFTNNNTHDQKQGTGPFKVEEMKFTEPVEPDLIRNLDPQKETSIARALKSNSSDGKDYLSCAIGKWHVYSEGATGFEPEAYGFDYNIGGSFRGQPAGGDRPGWDFYRGSGWSDVYFPNLESPEKRYPQKWEQDSTKTDDFKNLTYLSDALTYRALEFIDLASDQSRPFFLYLSHYGVHSPMQAKRWDSDGDGRITSKDKEVHADFFKARWGSDERHEIVPPSGSSSFHTSITYASMVKSIDESLGQIMRHLESKGMAENTIIFFYSDNGGVERNGYTCNNPLRSEKTHAYEGGTRVPFIACGPGVHANRISKLAVTGPDFFPTILELANIDMSAIEESSTIGFSSETIDGVSLVPLLQSTDSEFHRENDTSTSQDDGAIFWHVPHYKHSAPYSAVIKDNYKYIRYWEDHDSLQSRRETEDGYFMSEKELYNLQDNLEESGEKVLTGAQSSVEAELESILLNWIKRVDAKMPTAVRRENNQGITQAWYSSWISKQATSSGYEDPVEEAIYKSNPGDKITIYPGNLTDSIALPNPPDGITIQSMHP